MEAYTSFDFAMRILVPQTFRCFEKEDFKFLHSNKSPPLISRPKCTWNDFVYGIVSTPESRGFTHLKRSLVFPSPSLPLRISSLLSFSSPPPCTFFSRPLFLRLCSYNSKLFEKKAIVSRMVSKNTYHNTFQFRSSNIQR